ncbi:integrase [Rhizobium sp. YJ-22]|uniref:GPW/gp25 family protein n=1 Tax=Rhizobium sp. YJ-22 TaxID=3037556 RepID=UPI002412357A|nr:integrase [Rhizobium sp. YJ-22]MDG3580418.1 integrase [Rhizobium sp. YJ-22]
MAGPIRYRQGIDARTGAPLSGAAHLAQELRRIWMTRLNEMPMLLDYGSGLRGFLSEDITPALALSIYNELVGSTAKWEPEYDIQTLQFVRVTQDGSLALRHSGVYFPEGRYGNYDISQPLTMLPVRLGVAR